MIILKVLGYFVMKNFFEVLAIFNSLLRKHQFGVPIYTLHGDNACDFVKIQNFLASHNTHYQTPFAHDPRQNGVAEPKIETLLKRLKHFFSIELFLTL